MATHLAAWFQNTFGLSLAELNQVQDDILTEPSGTRFQVPTDYSTLAAVAALGNGITRAQLKAPSIAVSRATPEVLPRASGAAKFSLGFPEVEIFDTELTLDPTETLAMLQSDAAGVNFSHYGLAWFKKPGPLPAMPTGQILTVRATAAVTLTAQKWSTVTPVLDNDLQPGMYELVGMIAISATCVAARAIITGANYRPGVPGLAATEALAADFNPNTFKGLEFYSMGSFAHTNVPQVQFLADSGDTSETIFFLVIRTGDVGSAPSTPAA